VDGRNRDPGLGPGLCPFPDPDRGPVHGRVLGPARGEVEALGDCDRCVEGSRP
jgi:hypothetical protein